MTGPGKAAPRLVFYARFRHCGRRGWCIRMLREDAGEYRSEVIGCGVECCEGKTGTMSKHALKFLIGVKLADILERWKS